MVNLTAYPPFLDQLDHDQRQQRLEQIIKTRQGNVRQQHLQGASELYRRALARNPDDWQLHHNFGGLLVDMKDFTGAVLHFEAAVKLLPTYLPLRLALANALMEAGKTDEAIRQYRETLRLDPDFLPAKESLTQAEHQRPTRFSRPTSQMPLPKSP